MDRSRIACVGDGTPGGSISSMTQYAKTPFPGDDGRTPMYAGSKTPMYGSGAKTPMYGADEGKRCGHLLFVAHISIQLLNAVSRAKYVLCESRYITGHSFSSSGISNSRICL